MPKKPKVSPTTTTTQTIEKEVEAIKQKATLLANQNDPNDAFILLALDELAKTSRSARIDEADISRTNQAVIKKPGDQSGYSRVMVGGGGKASYVVGG